MENNELTELKPASYEVFVEDKVNAKGDHQPGVYVKLSRHLEEGEVTNIDMFIGSDLSALVERVKNTMKKLKDME